MITVFSISYDQVWFCAGCRLQPKWAEWGRRPSGIWQSDRGARTKVENSLVPASTTCYVVRFVEVAEAEVVEGDKGEEVDSVEIRTEDYNSKGEKMWTSRLDLYQFYAASTLKATNIVDHRKDTAVKIFNMPERQLFYRDRMGNQQSGAGGGAGKVIRMEMNVVITGVIKKHKSKLVNVSLL